MSACRAAEGLKVKAAVRLLQWVVFLWICEAATDEFGVERGV